MIFTDLIYKDLTDTLNTFIVKPMGDYIEEEDLKMVLKRRLTKKEYKTLMQIVKKDMSLEQLKVKLGLSDERHELILVNIKKKLNKSNTKSEIFLGK